MGKINVINDKTKGYTIMSNYHLRDSRLSLKAKGLMSYMLSLPDDWDLSVSGLSAKCLEGRDCITKALKELENFGYLVRIRVRNSKGQLKNTDYNLYEKPITENPSQAEKTTEPMTENPAQENPAQDNPKLENKAQINTNITNINTEQNTNHILSSDDKTDRIGLYIDEYAASDEYAESKRIVSTALKNAENAVQEIKKYEAYRELIKENIDYDCVISSQCSEGELEIVDSMVEVIAETMCCKEDYIRVGKRDLPTEVVKGKLMKLDYEYIFYVLGCLSKSSTPIKYVKSYLLTALYNAPDTFAVHTQAKYNSDICSP